VACGEDGHPHHRQGVGRHQQAPAAKAVSPDTRGDLKEEYPGSNEGLQGKDLSEVQAPALKKEGRDAGIEGQHLEEGNPQHYADVADS